MTRLPVPCVLIDKTRRDAILDAGYNLPTGEFDCEEFSAERWEVYDAVRDAVAEIWDPGIGDGDFYMEQEFELSRLLCIEVSWEQMLGPRLLTIVHEALSRFKADYCVDVCDSWVFLKTRDGQRFPHFNIFVEKQRILIYTESDMLLERLGLLRDGEMVT